MYTGAQVSLYPMTGDFIAVITDAIRALDPWRDRLRIDTDDISTLLIGPPEVLIPAIRDLYVAAARTGTHCVLHAVLSRGCPGGPLDTDADLPASLLGNDAPATPQRPLAVRQAEACDAVRAADALGAEAAAQFALYVMEDGGDHMAEILGCIGFLQRSGVFDREKNFVSRLRGDAGPVFATVGAALYRFGPPDGHVTMDLTVSANSPSAT